MLWVLAVLPLALGYTVYIAEVCRHGARSPWAYAPWDNDGRWTAPEQITPSGLRMHYLMGYELRNRFVIQEQFLSQNYRDGEVYAYSTDYNRTIMSAQSQLLGLYPSGTGPEIAPEVTKKAVPPIAVRDLNAITDALGNHALPNRTQIIPIHSEVTEESLILDPLGSSCQALSELSLARHSSSELNEIYAKYPDAISAVASYLNVSNSAAIEQFNSIWDSLFANRFHGYEIPEVFKNETLYERMSNLNLEVYTYLYYTDARMLKLQSSPLLRDIADYMNYARLGQTARKFTLYSGHDTTMLPLLASLNITIDSWADYASSLFFILSYDTSAGFQVSVYYNDEAVILKDCSVSPCPLDKFSEIVYNWSYSDMTEACKAELSLIFRELIKLFYEHFIGSLPQFILHRTYISHLRPSLKKGEIYILPERRIIKRGTTII
jgi:hypothetical protein